MHHFLYEILLKLIAYVHFLCLSKENEPKPAGRQAGKRHFFQGFKNFSGKIMLYCGKIIDYIQKSIAANIELTLLKNIF